MNKTLLIFCLLLVLVIGVVSKANVTNPQIRACNLTGGQVITASLAAPVNDQFLFCGYTDLALIDGVSVMSAINKTPETLALQAYRHSTGADSNACGTNDGVVVRGESLEGAPYIFCAFKDSTAIELSTLSRGVSDPANQALNQALGL